MVLSLTLYGYTFSNNNAYMTFTLAGGTATIPSVDFNPSNYKYNIVNSLTATPPVSTDPGWVVISGLSLVLNNDMYVTAQIPLNEIPVIVGSSFTIFIKCFNGGTNPVIYQYITTANSIYTKNTITNMTTFYPLLPNIITKALTGGDGGSTNTTSYIMYTSKALTINIPTEIWADSGQGSFLGPLYIISDDLITVNDSIQNNQYIVVIGNGMNLTKTTGLITITNTSFFGTNTINSINGASGISGLNIYSNLAIVKTPLGISSSSFYGKGSNGGNGDVGTNCVGDDGGKGGSGIQFNTGVTINYNTNPISFIGIGGSSGKGWKGLVCCPDGKDGSVGVKIYNNIVVAPGVTNA